MSVIGRYSKEDKFLSGGDIYKNYIPVYTFAHKHNQKPLIVRRRKAKEYIPFLN